MQDNLFNKEEEKMELSIDSIKDKPEFITKDSVNMITVMGSHAYGTNTPLSDWDFYGFIVPPAEFIFPNITGRFSGFGKQAREFNQFQGQHLTNNDGQEYDLTIYNISRYFHLCMEGNPNMIDSLFTDNESVLVSDNIGSIVRENRKIFLSQKCFHTFKGMAFSHISRLKNRERVGNRSVLIEKYGYDVKDASHIVRLVLELKQILFDGDLDLKFDPEFVLGVKNGNWTKEQVIVWFEDMMKRLEEYVSSGHVYPPYSPDEKRIHSLLAWCLEEKYGSLSKYGYNVLGDS